MVLFNVSSFAKLDSPVFILLVLLLLYNDIILLYNSLHGNCYCARYFRKNELFMEIDFINVARYFGK